MSGRDHGASCRFKKKSVSVQCCTSVHR